MVVVLVCGSRSIDNQDIVFKAICGAPFEVEKIVHGGAKGVDSHADTYAALNGIEVEEVTPDYEAHGDNAPLIRNEKMVDKCHAVIAVWDGDSKGTKYTIDHAKDEGRDEVGRVNHTSDIGVIYLALPALYK